MFIMKAAAIILLSLNVANGSELANNTKKEEQSTGRSSRRLIQYNQPELVSIPVAIVFDDNEDRKGKSIDTVSKLNTNFSPENDKATEKSNAPTLIRLNSDFSVHSSENEKYNSKQPPAKVSTEDGLQIPVAVVYDESSVTPRIQKKGILRRKQGNRLHAGSQTRKVPKTTTQLPIVEENKITLNNEEEAKIVTTSDRSLSIQTLDHDSKTRKRTRERDPVIPIIQSENRVFAHNGDFHYSYEGGDGTKAFETGELKSFDDNKTGEAVMGGFSYTDKDGQDYSLSYTADENGYRPVGAHLPTPPPIPPAIERALRYLATKTTPETVTDSSKSKFSESK